MSADATELGILAALAASRGQTTLSELQHRLDAAELDPDAVQRGLQRLLADGKVQLETASRSTPEVSLTQAGSVALLQTCARIEAALDNSPSNPGQEDCPSIPWLTTVQTEWIDALSINYAVQPERLAQLLPEPLVPEIFEGSAWVQVLMSSLRDMRPQGLASVFGVSFYQISYRAAVRYRNAEGVWRRGGYFIRSETNHAVMRAVGNTLVEFRFHEFGAAQMLMVRDGNLLTVGVDTERPGGKLVATVDTQPLEAPPSSSVWRSLEHLQQPLVECYDAYGVDREGGWLYTLTIDRDPWDARFVAPRELYCEYVDTGALGGDSARLDSVLHIPRCAYRWRPLRRERFREETV